MKNEVFCAKMCQIAMAYIIFLIIIELDDDYHNQVIEALTH